MLCAVIGAATRSRAESLLAGSVGLVVAIVHLQSGHTTALGTVMISIILALPYLAGFGGATLVTALLPSEPRPTPSALAGRSSGVVSPGTLPLLWTARP